MDSSFARLFHLTLTYKLFATRWISMAFGCNHCRAILFTEAREVKRWSDGLKKARRPSQIRIAKDMEPLWHRRCAKLYNHSPYFVVWTTSCRLLIFTFSEKRYPPPKKKGTQSIICCSIFNYWRYTLLSHISDISMSHAVAYASHTTTIVGRSKSIESNQTQLNATKSH